MYRNGKKNIKCCKSYKHNMIYVKIHLWHKGGIYIYIIIIIIIIVIMIIIIIVIIIFTNLFDDGLDKS